MNWETMGFWRGFTRGRIREDRGAYAVMFAIIIVVIFAMVAVVVDLGADKSNVRRNRSYADLAALAAALNLPNGQAACNTAWTYLVLNGAVPLGTPSPCSSLPTTCNVNNPIPATATKTIGSTVFTFTFPVPDSYLASLSTPAEGTGARPVDQKPCDRMGVDVRSTTTSFFGGIFGSGRLSAPATAVVVRSPGVHKVPVALLLLEPHGCEVLTTGGNNVQVFVHAAPADSLLGFDPNGGRITADSDAHPVSGDNSCNGGNTVVDVNGSDPDRVKTFNTTDIDPTFAPVGPGVIELYAIQPPDSTCTAINIACKLSQISPPGIAMVDAQKANGTVGVPSSLAQRVSRAPFDNQFNCQASYPDYLGIVPILLDSLTCSPGVRPSYINNLVQEIDGSGTTTPPPGSWTVLGTGKKNDPACSVTNTKSFSGNYYVNCDTFSVSGNGVANFNNGNVVFQGSVVVTATLNINTAPTLPATAGWLNCLTKVLGCTTQWSPGATFVYMRSGGSASCSNGAKCTLFQVSGGSGRANLNNTVLYFRDPTVFGSPTSCGTYPGSDTCLNDDGQLEIKGGSLGASMVAPVEGPFRNLALWNESSLPQTLQGQGTIILTGVFFTPTAPVTYQGQGCSTPTNSQFVARTLAVTGGGATGGCLNMRPTPGRTVNINEFGPLLIR